MLVRTRKLRSILIVTNNKAHLNKYLLRRVLGSQNKIKKKKLETRRQLANKLGKWFIRILSDIK